MQINKSDLKNKNIEILYFYLENMDGFESHGDLKKIEEIDLIMGTFVDWIDLEGLFDGLTTYKRDCVYSRINRELEDVRNKYERRDLVEEAISYLKKFL